MGVYAGNSSTVVCEGCPPASSTPDIVTREPVPTTPCTAGTLMVVTQSGSGSSPTGGMGGGMGGGAGGGAGNPTATGSNGAPTGPVVTAGGNVKAAAGSLGGLVAFAAAAAIF